MKINNRPSAVQLLLALCFVVITQAAAASDSETLGNMLREFLAAAHQQAAHERFWADDLIYTSSSGLRFGKADIMQGFETAEDQADAAVHEPAVVYAGEDVDVRVYGDMAVVAFKLVGTPSERSDSTQVSYYFNTGTFLKRDGVWKVVAWQATKIPAVTDSGA